jgi:tetratricopeptide (TPR) repeat protein
MVCLKRGRLGDARTHLEEAHALFRQVNNEQHRIAALYNLAHLAREERRLDDASRLYGATAALARAVGLHEVVLGATAGIGLMALGASDLAEAAAVRSQLRNESQLSAGWFQGRELLEAFLLQMELLDDDLAAAVERFEKAVQLGTPHDTYGTAWLVATCAPLVVRRGAQCGSVRTILRAHAERAGRLGSTPLRTQLAALSSEYRCAESEEAHPVVGPQSKVS